MLPVKATQTNMIDCGDGNYEATAANQEILQSVDVAALSTQYGVDSRVTGISLIGNPAYRTAEGLCALTAIEKSGGNITEYGRHIVEHNEKRTGKPTIDKGLATSLICLSTDCLRQSFVYKPAKDARRLLPHLLRVVRVKILRDCCVGMPETCGNVNRLRTCFDETRRVCMAEAVRVQSEP